jgi:hypothetical protein
MVSAMWGFFSSMLFETSYFSTRAGVRVRGMDKELN